MENASVFVYGTLVARRGQSWLVCSPMRGSWPSGAHRTEPCFTLYALGGYPGLIGGGRTAISGEVYRVNQATLCMLDRLEDYPRLYLRRLIQTRFGRAWVYLYRGPVKDRAVIESGDWRDLSRDGSPHSHRGRAQPARSQIHLSSTTVGGAT
jgi:gamma-glutamylaminecyclotransferase